MSKKILYIGNNLNKITKYPTTLEFLSRNLEIENFRVKIASDKLNIILRQLDMLYSIVKYRYSDYVLIDTYSTTNFYYALFCSQFARIFNLKYIPILHGGNLPSRLRSNPFLCKLIFKNAYKIVAPSNYLKSEFEKYNFKTDHIPNSIPIAEYNYKERNKIIPKLLWVRSFKKLYNPTLAIKVFSIIKAKFPEAELCMVGPFKDESHQESLALAKKYNMSDSVEFTGVLSKKEWHKKSEDFSFFINTTNFDNTPISVIEAMALGLTVVSTNVGGMPFLIEHNIDGILVPPNDKNLMANEIINIIENNRTSFSKNARRKAESFDWNVVKKKWLQILK